MLNIVALMGRLTADPELKTTYNGTAVVRFTLAVNRYAAKDGNNDKTSFINIVAWRQTAEFVNKYFKKGQLVAVDGYIETRKYQDKNGNARTAFEVIANNVHFAEKKDGLNNQENNFNNNLNQQENAIDLDNIEPNINSDNNDFQEINSEDDDDLPF